jgi:glyoxylase-like metal-dependent hydrolase (beta-lactamase superfamily II)
VKNLHRPDLFTWSRFDEERNVDFNSFFWKRDGGNVVIDPLPLSPHDEKHVRALGGISLVVITNSDHVREAENVRRGFGAEVAAPAGERERFPIAVDRWIGDGDAIVTGLVARALDGSKTPGELALLLEDTTLITGDLVRAHRAGSLMLLPDAKLADPARAKESARRLLEWEKVETVLVGDGWHFFGGAREELERVLGP